MDQNTIVYQILIAEHAAADPELFKALQSPPLKERIAQGLQKFAGEHEPKGSTILQQKAWNIFRS